MIKKTLIPILLSIVLVLQPFSTQKASANSFAETPGYVDEAFAGLMAAAMAVGAAGIHANEYVVDNLNLVKEAAAETWRTLAPEVQQQFSNAVASGQNMISVSEDTISTFLSKYLVRTQFVDSSWVDMPVTDWAKGSAYADYSLPTSIYMKFEGDTAAEKYGYKRKTFYLEIVNNHVVLSQSASSLNLQVYAPSYTWQQLHVDTVGELYSLLRSVGFGVSVLEDATNKVLLQTDATAKSVNDYLKDFDTWRNEAGWVLPKPQAYTPNNVRLGVNESTGTLTLPDGTTYQGDVTWRMPTTTVTTIDGVSIPTTTTAEGDIVNILTGEVVVPAEVNPPIETPAGTFTPPTVALDFSPLMINAQELTTKFPFSIPWDFIRQLNAFAVEPAAPKFDINIPNYFTVEDQRQSMTWTLDFQQFDLIGQLFRWFILIIFDIGLILGIRRLLPE